MTTFDSMGAEFQQKNAADERNAMHEVMQQIALDVWDAEFFRQMVRKIDFATA